MGLKDGAPKTRLVIDYDFAFSGSPVRSLTVVPERGEDVKITAKLIVLTLIDELKNAETITIERSNLLWFSMRPRQQKLAEPKKPPVPPDVSST